MASNPGHHPAPTLASLPLELRFMIAEYLVPGILEVVPNLSTSQPPLHHVGALNPKVWQEFIRFQENPFDPLVPIPQTYPEKRHSRVVMDLRNFRKRFKDTIPTHDVPDTLLANYDSFELRVPIFSRPGNLLLYTVVFDRSPTTGIWEISARGRTPLTPKLSQFFADIMWTFYPFRQYLQGPLETHVGLYINLAMWDELNLFGRGNLRTAILGNVEESLCLHVSPFDPLATDMEIASIYTAVLMSRVASNPWLSPLLLVWYYLCLLSHIVHHFETASGLDLRAAFAMLVVVALFHWTLYSVLNLADRIVLYIFT